MNDTKREELEKACKKEKDHKVRARMVAVRMVRVRNMPAEGAADIRGRSPNWIHRWLRRYNGGLQDLRIFPIPERRGRVLASGKAQAVGFRILSDIFRHVPGRLYLLSNGTVPFGIDQLCEQKNCTDPHEFMIFAIDPVPSEYTGPAD